MKKIGMFFLTIIAANIANAGIANLTSHSRANCVNNESIDWDATSYHYLCTISDHYYRGKLSHEVNTGWQDTWRSAAVHWAESPIGSRDWTVNGIHWEIINRIPYNIANETVFDCSVYDGWWGFKKEKKQTLASLSSNNIPLSKADIKKMKNVPTGISIVPFKDTIIPDLLKEKMMLEIKAKNSAGYKGFDDDDSPNVKILLNILNNKSLFSDTNDPYDTHIKSSLSYLRLAFPFTGIKNLESKNLIGYAVSGSWVNNGWTGVTEFFNDPELGVCRYAVKNALLNKLSVQLSIEETKYEINNKPSIANIKGGQKNGFMYRIDWFDDTYFSSIECANMKFDKSIMGKIINLANEIDHNR